MSTETGAPEDDRRDGFLAQRIDGDGPIADRVMHPEPVRFQRAVQIARDMDAAHMQEITIGRFQLADNQPGQSLDIALGGEDLLEADIAGGVGRGITDSENGQVPFRPARPPGPHAIGAGKDERLRARQVDIDTRPGN